MALNNPGWYHQYIRTAAGTRAGAAGSGAYTMAALVNLSASTSGIMHGVDSTGALSRAFFFDSNLLVGQGDFTGVNASAIVGNWAWVVITKAAGSTNYRIHYALYAASGALTWTHANSGTFGDGNPINEFRLGQGTDVAEKWNSSMALAAVWTTALSDSAVATNLLRTAQGVANSGASAIWLMPLSLGSTAPVQDALGHGADESGRELDSQASLITAVADPSGFDFTIAPLTIDHKARHPSTWDAAAVVKCRRSGAWVIPTKRWIRTGGGWVQSV